MSDAADFEAHRRHLTGLAYRMLGSVAEAEDVVQDAWLRWRSAEDVERPRAWLSRVVTRLCLDHLKSARVRRERYVGPWLPEPVLDADALRVEAPTELASDLSVALLLALERLSPLERAAFLLHDVFDVDHAEVAEALARTPAACRQLAARARAHVRAARPRFPVDDADAERVAFAFFAAAQAGDPAALTAVLAEDAVFYSDAGGHKQAALKPVVGRDRVTRFLVGVARKFGSGAGLRDVRFVRLNGLPGLVAVEADGGPYAVALEVRGGVVGAVYVMRNPEKLGHLGG